MENFLEDLALPALVHALEINVQEIATLWGRALGAEFHYGAEATWFVTGVPFLLCNWVTHAQFGTDTQETALDEFLQRIRTYNFPVLWLVGPSMRPFDLMHRLTTSGWRGGKTPGMAADLQLLDTHQAHVTGLTIERVSTGETLQQWLRTFAAGYPVPQFVLDHVLDLQRKHGFVQHPSVYYYLARLNGEPVATSLLFLGSEVAGLYCVATLPHARRRGIGRLVSLAPLLDAKAMKYRVAILQSSDAGMNVYKALGFQQYCTLGFYVSPDEMRP